MFFKILFIIFSSVLNQEKKKNEFVEYLCEIFVFIQIYAKKKKLFGKYIY